MSVDELNERQYQQKIRKLANSELAKPLTDAKNETFAEQLMTKVLNNLQFSVTNIHVRYEDNVSAPQRFAAGITLSELSAISTDENWIPQTIGDAINTIHKVSTGGSNNNNSGSHGIQSVVSLIIECMEITLETSD